MPTATPFHTRINFYYDSDDTVGAYHQFKDMDSADSFGYLYYEPAVMWPSTKFLVHTDTSKWDQEKKRTQPFHETLDSAQSVIWKTIATFYDDTVGAYGSWGNYQSSFYAFADSDHLLPTDYYNYIRIKVWKDESTVLATYYFDITDCTSKSWVQDSVNNTSTANLSSSKLSYQVDGGISLSEL